MNIDKAKVNAAVKKIKQIRAESEKKKNEPKTANFTYQEGSERERTLMGIGFAMAMALLFGGRKKKSFISRTRSFYSKALSLIDATAAQQLSIDNERKFKDKKLEALEIEDAVKFEL